MPNQRSAQRSERFREIRKQHSFEQAEDYTELIADLIQEKGQARVCEIAKILGISHVTAIKTIERLERDGYLQTRPYKPIELTDKGQRMAKFCKQRHEMLCKFFGKIGVPSAIAETDVEGIEHHISQETLAHIERFLNQKI